MRRPADGDRGAAVMSPTPRGSSAFVDRLRTRRMIASIKEPKQIESALEARHRLGGVFLLTGHIGVIKSYVELFRKHDVPAFLHLEKIGGLSTDAYGLEYLANAVRPTGVVTTKTNVVKSAKKLGLLAVQRFFLIDTEGLDNLAKSLEQIQPDIVELMPALMPETIARVKAGTTLPIITGGLLSDRSQALECLRHGAIAVSSSKKSLWQESLLGDFTEVS